MTETILISRTDKIGDVILTLPVAGLLKRLIPDARIAFLGRSYTRAIIAACEHVDLFLDWNDLKGQTLDEARAFAADNGVSSILHVFPRKEISSWARRAGIPTRVGTSHRFHHWLNCTKLVRLGRKRSPLHEAELNLRLLAPLVIEPIDWPSREAIGGLFGMTRVPPPTPKVAGILADKGSRRDLILHPMSFGSAREWPVAHYRELIARLPADRFRIIITGGPNEAEPLRAAFGDTSARVCAGEISLSELITLIDGCDGLVAASTGPLHIAAALGKHALGLYPPIRPMHPGRWAPLGPRAETLTAKDECDDCRRNPTACACMAAISPDTVAERILAW